MKKFSTSFRGYDKNEVNSFVGEVADKYESMLNNLKDRDKKIIELTNEVKRYKNIESSFNNAFKVAEETSSQMKRIARNEANSIINEARNNASKIINNALLKAEKIETENQALKHRTNLLKRKIKQTLEDELAMLDDIDDFDY